MKRGSGNMGVVSIMAQARYDKHRDDMPRASLILTAEDGELHMSGIGLTHEEALGFLRDGIKLLENQGDYNGTDKDLA